MVNPRFHALRQHARVLLAATQRVGSEAVSQVPELRMLIFSGFLLWPYQR